MTKSEELGRRLGIKVKDKVLVKGLSLHKDCGGRIDIIERTYGNGKVEVIKECQKCLAWDRKK